MGVKLAAASGGSIELVPTNTASNFTVTVPAGTGTLAVQGVSTNIASGTAVASTSGTSIDFTSIPSWVNRITVMFNGVSTNGTSAKIIRIGAGSIDTTGYASTGAYVGSVSAATQSTVGLLLDNSPSVGDATFGSAVLTTLGSNIWVMSSTSSPTTSNFLYMGAGGKTLSGTLDRLRITMVNGTDTFDAGSINILYE